MYAPASIADDAPAAATRSTTTAEPETDIGNFLLAQIVKYRRETWRWERLMRVPRTRAAHAAERSNDREQRVLILNAWKAKAEKRRRQAANPPRRTQWLCIHRYERHPHQGWATATGNGYYGGLQMDLSFQRTYAPELLRTKGTANKWTALEQIWVAERAYRSGRGFLPVAEHRTRPAACSSYLNAGTGSIAAPRTRSSKCRCGPVARAGRADAPDRSARRRRAAPGLTRIADRCAYTVLTPSSCLSATVFP